jgi:hypothetical protein
LFFCVTFTNRCGQGKLEDVKKLIEQNKDIWKERIEGVGGIHMAVGCGHLEVAKHLLSCGESINSKIFNDGPSLQVCFHYYSYV